MKKHTPTLFLLIAAFLFCTHTVYAADWTLVSVTAAPLSEDQQKNSSDPAASDIMLSITLRNDAKKTQYLQTVGGWYLIKAFIRDPDSKTWKLQTPGIDQPMKWSPVTPGEIILTGRRQSGSEVGASMMLTFQRAWSTGDHSGSAIMLDPFKIPAPPKTKSTNTKAKAP